jgi:ABC-type multidrug transport system fused ATPase/permease subunit
LKIKEGEKVALVGSSGCGKSTVMQLLLGFYAPTRGEILINGVSISDYDVQHMRRQCGVVGQEPTVFNSSFRDNIRYNAELCSEEDIRGAARKANALDFIEGKDSEEKSGFDAVVGAKGLHISGGQKQRVAIARVILRNPKMLLLDEATSALDAENERIVQDSLDSIMEDRTIVTVAHRIETIKNSDTIYVIEKGSVVESGTYD